MTGIAQYPLRCPACDSQMVLRQRNFGERVWYECPRGCDQRVAAHRGTGKPMGTPGDKRTRQARTDAHLRFDEFWQGRGWSRAQAYQWLADTLMLQRGECHIGEFSLERCRQVIAAVEVFEYERGKMEVADAKAR